MIRIFCFFSSIALSILQVQAQKDNYINYTIDDGLPSNMVYCVQQDDRGFMWFGTDAGLSKYDGYEFTNYTLNDDLPDVEILHFFKDSQSRIWFYTLNGKVGFLKNDSIYSSKNTDWLAPLDFEGRITEIIEVDGKIYFSSVGSHIKILDEVNTIKINLGGKQRIKNSLCYCRNKLYVFSLNGVFSFDKKFGLKREMDYKLRELIYPFCYKDKLYAFDRSTDNHGIVQVDDSIKSFRTPAKNYILNFEEHNGILYLFRRNDILVFDEEEMYLSLHSAEYQSVSSMLIDREGNSWLTSIEKGVYLKPQTEIELKLNVKYVSALEKKDDYLLLAHDKLFVSKLNSSNDISAHTSFTDFNTVNLIYNDSNDNLWIARNNGLFLNGQNLVSAGGFSIISIDDGFFMTGRSVVSVGKSKVGTELKKYKIPSYGLASVLIGNDSILIGTDNGLMLVNKDTITEYQTSPLLKSRITNLIFDENKNLWIGTGGKGLVKYNDSISMRISKEDGLVSDIIDEILMIDDSVIWLSTPQGINKVVINQGRVSIDLLNSSNGLMSYKINDLILFKEDIYLATNDGLFSFPKNINLKEPNDFRLFIDEVLVDNVKASSKVFSDNTTSVQIKYKAIVYRNHNSLSYQYKLNTTENTQSDDKWLDTDFNQINFLNLNPNKYSFLVRAKTKNSDWSSPISYDFEIKPAFWQSPWFPFFIICLTVSMVIFYFNQVNKRRIAKKNLEKTKLKAELTALKAQINPHFLFNVLNSIQSFILENEKDIAQEYLVKYGRLMRMVLDDSDQLIVPLESEIELIMLYTDLEKLRLKNGFYFEVLLSEEIKSKRVLVPSMIIQPFIENAIWHGLSPLGEKGKITLKIDHVDEHIKVLIMDNGVGFNSNSNKTADHNSSGVRLVHERLNLIQSPKQFKNKLEIKSEIGKGTRITILFSDSLQPPNL